MIRVLLADDHPTLRAGLRATLAEARDITVVGEAADGPSTLALATGADVVVLDLSMPGPGFQVIIEQLTTEHPHLRVLVLSMHTDARYAVAALRAGAVGYLTKDRTESEVVEAVRTVARDRRYITRPLAEQLAELIGRGPDAVPTLSEREAEVLRLLGEGLSGKEIGARLGISPKTVSTYRTRLLEKLGLRTTADLIRYAMEHPV